jgi:hypothetical protein
MTVFIIVLTLINIGLWLVFLLKFRRLFSTDKIIEKTKARVNEIEKQINTITDRNLYIAKETKNNIETMLNDVDRKMDLFKEATQRLRSMISEADKINRLSNQSLSLHQDFSKISKPKSVKKIDQIDKDAVYSANIQGDLFISNEKLSILKDETKITPDGTAYKEVPLIHTNVLDDIPIFNSVESYVESKRKVSEKKVKEKYLEGLNVEQIAAELKCSVVEVQFIIDML